MAGAQQQPGHSMSGENAVRPLRPEPFIPVVVVSPNNTVDIARRVSDGDKKSLQSPFGQDQGQSTAPSFSRGSEYIHSPGAHILHSGGPFCLRHSKYRV